MTEAWFSIDDYRLFATWFYREKRGKEGTRGERGISGSTEERRIVRQNRIMERGRLTERSLIKAINRMSRNTSVAEFHGLENGTWTACTLHNTFQSSAIMSRNNAPPAKWSILPAFPLLFSSYNWIVTAIRCPLYIPLDYGRVCMTQGSASYRLKTKRTHVITFAREIDRAFIRVSAML